MEAAGPAGAGRPPTRAVASGAAPRVPGRRRRGVRRLRRRLPAGRHPAANAAATAQSNVYLYADGAPRSPADGADQPGERAARPGARRPSSTPCSPPRTATSTTSRRSTRKAMVRAAWNTVTGKGRQSGSTITQQYVKNYYLNQEQTASAGRSRSSSSRSSSTASRASSRSSQGYLNTSYFGRNAYGIQAAAQAYYHRTSSDAGHRAGRLPRLAAQRPQRLRRGRRTRENRARGARPAGTTCSTAWSRSTGSPRRPGAAMRFPAPDQTAASPRAVRPARLPRRGRQGLPGRTTRSSTRPTLRRGGYRITTTIDRRRSRTPSSRPSRTNCWTGSARSGEADRYVRAGGASIDPNTGEVVALYGGVDYTQQYVNNATRRDYQVGSTFKPFVFAAALQHDSQDPGRPTPSPPTPSTTASNHRPVQGRNGPVGYAPANEDDRRLRRHHRHRRHRPVGQRGLRPDGPGRRRRARSRHRASTSACPPGTPSLSAHPSIALGAATASPLDMAQALRHARQPRPAGPVLAGHQGHQGRHDARAAAPGPPAGGVAARPPTPPPRCCRSVVDADGTGTAAQAAGRPAAGKTGTAEDDKAAWFAGYTPTWPPWSP